MKRIVRSGERKATGERKAQIRFGTAKRAAAFDANQRLDHLNGPMQAFIARQDMVSIATADGDGHCDCSFRAGDPGFVQVLNSRTLAYPEFRGNGVLASVGNILENPHIGMIFLDYCETTLGLHVNGRARVLESGELLSHPDVSPEIRAAAQRNGGRRPEMWVLVDIEETYIHCSKHVPLMKRLDKQIHWGTDDEKMKNGNFFKVQSNAEQA